MRLPYGDPKKKAGLLKAAHQLLERSSQSGAPVMQPRADRRTRLLLFNPRHLCQLIGMPDSRAMNRSNCAIQHSIPLGNLALNSLYAFEEFIFNRSSGGPVDYGWPA